MAFLDLPPGARIVDQRVSHGRLFLNIEVDRAPATPPCPTCGFAEAMHIPPGSGHCPPIDARRRGEGVYVDRDL